MFLRKKAIKMETRRRQIKKQDTRVELPPPWIRAHILRCLYVASPTKQTKTEDPHILSNIHSGQTSRKCPKKTALQSLWRCVYWTDVLISTLDAYCSGVLADLIHEKEAAASRSLMEIKMSKKTHYSEPDSCFSSHSWLCARKIKLLYLLKGYVQSDRQTEVTHHTAEKRPE